MRGVFHANGDHGAGSVLALGALCGMYLFAGSNHAMGPDDEGIARNAVRR